jgi:hypothetical protein
VTCRGSDAHVAHQLAATDRVARAVDDDAGDHRHPPGGGGDRRADEIAELLRVERMALAGRAAGGKAVRAGRNEKVHLPRPQPPAPSPHRSGTASSSAE